jgi:hypothetical protein
MRQPLQGKGWHLGRYESWYFRAVHPDLPLGLWVRHTHHVLRDRRIRGARWLTLFEPEGVTARKTSFDGQPAADGVRFEGEAEDAQWDVVVEPVTSMFLHLPKRWMYRTPLPKTKPVSVHPLATFDGKVTVGDRVIAIEGWRGMVGHNWGSEHAHRWIWLHVAGFDEAPDAWLDLTLARLKIGGLVTGWIPNGAFEMAGQRHRLGGFLSKPDVSEKIGKARIVMRGSGIEVDVVVEAPSEEATVFWQYGDPAGAKRYVANCSIARALVQVRDASGETRLTSRHGGAYELGMSEAPVGRSVQPYPDP